MKRHSLDVPALPRTSRFPAPRQRMARRLPVPSPSICVFDARRRPLARPSEFVITSASRLVDLKWRSWGGRQATAVGDLEIAFPRSGDGQTGAVRFPSRLELRGREVEDGTTYYALFRVFSDRVTPAEMTSESHPWSPTANP